MLKTSLENAKRHPKNVALLGLREGQDLDGEVERVTWRALEEKVRKASNALRSCSVGKVDVVAVLVSNSVEAVVLFLSSANCWGCLYKC
jgi:acyl-coenzyme A synthetase/AMP-(fatty) acid ligase